MVKQLGFILSLSLVFGMFFWGCDMEAGQKLTEEEEAYIEDAIPIAEEMLDLRESEELYDSEHNQLEPLYTVYTTKTDASQVWWTAYSEQQLNDFQRKTGGIEDYELLNSKITTRLLDETHRVNGYYVTLMYKVTGPKGESKEKIGLWKVHPDEESSGTINGYNEDAFRIIYHSQRL